MKTLVFRLLCQLNGVLFINPRGPRSACLLRSTQLPREGSWRPARWYLAQARASNIHLASLAVAWCLGSRGEEAAPTLDWVPTCTPASAPAHLTTGSPGAPSSPRASAPFAVPFSAAPLPAHFPACLALGLFLKICGVSGRCLSLTRCRSVRPGSQGGAMSGACSSYVSAEQEVVRGFSCPLPGGEAAAVFCCGFRDHKYCCDDPHSFFPYEHNYMWWLRYRPWL